ncbi:MAG: threonine/serine dehydratase, partial [Halolamina sp.]
PTLADVEAAAERVAPVTHRTPLDPSTTFAERSGATEVRLKLENMQRTGSFKARGAYNKLAQLPEAEREAGVVTISAGNHAQGVAYAAREFGVDATVVMPTFTPAAKVEATRGYGATVELHGTEYQEFYDRAMELVEAEDRTFLHPFDDPAVIAGQGTVGLEIVEAFPEVDTVVTPVGGGGLVSGVATAVTAETDARVVGVETVGSAHAKRSLERGGVEPREDLDTIAEGIAAGRLGERTLRIIDEKVDELVEVEEDAVTAAMALLAERANTVAEAAAATPTAALLSGHIDAAGENVALLVSGGNVDLTEFGDLTTLGLESLDRYVHARLALTGWPDPVGDVTETVEEHGAELDVLRPEPPEAGLGVNRRPVAIAVAGTGPDHLRAVLSDLDSLAGVTVVGSDLAD